MVLWLGLCAFTAVAQVQFLVRPKKKRMSSSAKLEILVFPKQGMFEVELSKPLEC